MYFKETFSLPDGRTLGYVVHGDPQGQPVLAFLGLWSRRFYPVDETIAAGLGLQVITLDRPGLGLSDPKPDRTLLDWPDDVAALAEEINLDRFAVIGIHQGGPYAAATAFKLADRVTSLSLVSSPAPPEVEVSTSNLMDRVVALTKLYADRQPPLTHAWIKQNPVKAWQRFHHALPECDRVLVQEYGPRYLKPAFMREVIDELYRQGTAGAEQDEVLLAGPWGFDVRQIKAPAHIWQGGLDKETPPAVGGYWAQTLAGSTLHLQPGAGHWFYLRDWREILSQIVGK